MGYILWLTSLENAVCRSSYPHFTVENTQEEKEFKWQAKIKLINSGIGWVGGLDHEKPGVPSSRCKFKIGGQWECGP